MNYFDDSSPKDSKPSIFKVYFKDIHRIHINRFKGYTHILADRLKHLWHVTDDLSQANVVIIQKLENSDSTMHVELYDAMPHLTPKPFECLKLIFSEMHLVKTLNTAGNKLQSALQKSKSNPAETRSISQLSCYIDASFCGACNWFQTVHLTCCPDVVAEELCDRLNHLNQHQPRIQFSYLADFLNNTTTAVKHLAYVINPYEVDSINGYFEIEQRRETMDIDQLTVLIVRHEDEAITEQIFDDIYGRSDDNTLVTLMDTASDKDLMGYLQTM